ncbi:MAG: hypothetical protein FJ011_13440, partial [Chloroflexi bacterium]|nr:hypothetical protein [Chloroflexota bacterium]
MPAAAFQFNLMFHNSQIHDLNGIVELAHFLAAHGFLPADKTPKSPIEPVDNISHLVHKHLIDYSQDPVGQKVMGVLWSVRFWLVIPDKPDLIASCSFEFNDPQRKRLQIGGLADFEFRDQRHYVE